MCYTENKSSFIEVYRFNKVLTHQNIKGWWISKTKTYLAGLKKCFSFLSVNYAQRSCCKLHAPYNFFQFLSFIYDPTHLRLGGTKKNFYLVPTLTEPWKCVIFVSVNTAHASVLKQYAYYWFLIKFPFNTNRTK